jgi:hypothetical protein
MRGLKRVQAEQIHAGQLVFVQIRQGWMLEIVSFPF